MQMEIHHDGGFNVSPDNTYESEYLKEIIQKIATSRYKPTLKTWVSGVHIVGKLEE